MKTQRDLPYYAGTASADITPPLDVGLLMSSVEQRWEPFHGVRLPLQARALFVTDGTARVAMVSLDLLGLDDVAVGGMTEFKSRIAAASGAAVEPGELLLVSTHTHTAPESLGLSELHLTPAFQEWVDLLVARIGEAVRVAAATTRPARLSYGKSAAPGLSIHRRIKTTQGVMLSHPMPPSEIVLSDSGPVDESVNVVALKDEEGRYLCVLVNATCHPVHEMCIPSISPDYPGELCRILHERYGCDALFLNGAAGNINPPTVSGGASYARSHAMKLAQVVEETLGKAIESRSDELLLLRRAVILPARSFKGCARADMINAPVAVLRMGDVAFVLLPGEPFVETGLSLRERSSFPLTCVVEGLDAYIGYVPTDEAFAEGGYETGPGRWSRLMRGSEPALRSACLGLLREAGGGAAATRADRRSAEGIGGAR